ncbi:phenylalanine 4-monooxygenase [Brevundimonas sp.]|uniref:phenylalanine 4-monooxygenase n=1 Tax=Brevundimonas sp. TaxID=1871086 RepID=UPI001DEC9B5C|nr:phenylalanine 4-monooxygenase [Brevundimonas sp.]MBL0947030.1 phenylalanine 4-monooxygenase [Brevundimonas sp.]
MSDFEHVFEAPPEGAAEDWTIPQNWSAYTPVEHDTWNTLYARQMKILPGRASQAFLNGLKALDLNTGGIPDFEAMNPRLQALTGWTVVCVPGLVPDDVFFDHLANRRFPSGQFIRRPDQLDYLQEPDIFHDVFGHVPMLTDPDFAAYMEAYGKGGQRAARRGMLTHLARLYWYTVEFGLMKEGDDLRIYGAGIVSSSTESVFALEDPSPNRLGFDLERVMRTLYRIDDFQQVYFVIDSLEALKDETLKDFGPIYDRLEGQDDIAIDAILPSDTVFTRGTQAYAAKGGRFAA